MEKLAAHWAVLGRDRSVVMDSHHCCSISMDDTGSSSPSNTRMNREVNIIKIPKAAACYLGSNILAARGWLLGMFAARDISQRAPPIGQRQEYAASSDLSVVQIAFAYQKVRPCDFVLQVLFLL